MEEEKGISLGEIFKVILKRIWWVVAATAAAMIVFVCVIQFWYNPNNQSYSATYEIRLPSGDAYPDGTTLRLADSVLLENLQIIKDETLLPESKRTGKFAGVNIEKMVEEDDIKFMQTVVKKEDETYEYYSTVKISKKYFKDSEQATDFIRAVVEFPVDNAKNIVNSMNYTERLLRYVEYKTYDEKIDALIGQKNYIVEMYEKISDLYSGDYVPAGLNSEKTIDDYIRDLTDVFDVREQEAVRNIVSSKYYVSDVQPYIDNAQAKIEALNIEIANNNRIISELQEARKNLMLTGSIQATEAYEVRIAELTVENAKKLNEVEKTQTTLERIKQYTEGADKEAKASFDKRLNDIRDQLKEATQTMKKVNIATYEEKSQTIYVNNKIVVDGGFSIIIAAVVGAVLGFVIAAVVIFIIDYPKYKRAKLAAEAEAPKEEGEQSESEEKA